MIEELKKHLEYIKEEEKAVNKDSRRRSEIYKRMRNLPLYYIRGAFQIVIEYLESDKNKRV